VRRKGRRLRLNHWLIGALLSTFRVSDSRMKAVFWTAAYASGFIRIEFPIVKLSFIHLHGHGIQES
jgi:hypothetical protein